MKKAEPAAPAPESGMMKFVADNPWLMVAIGITPVAVAGVLNMTGAW